MHQDRPSAPNKLSIWLPLLFAIVLVTGMLLGMRMQSNMPKLVVEQEAPGPEGIGQGKIEEILRYVEAKYVDAIDKEALTQEVIDDLLSRLDPHSNYISAEELQAVNEQLKGNFDGIGVEFMVLDDTIVVVTPLAGGPSETAGILSGDRIVQIADSTIAGVGMDSDDIIKMLRGEKGTDVQIGILRGKETKLRQFTVTRDEIPMNSVDVAYMLDTNTGYIKVNRFSATTYEEFMKALEELVENQGMEDLVLDLRHNPGGYLQQATNMLSQLFKEKDQLLVYTEGDAVSRSEYTSTGRNFFDVEDIVVLIDEGSASASEIVAGAIQDHDRGVIIGRRSFGKGLVQEQYKLRDGAALRLTVARYYTPSGRSIQKPYDDPEAYEHEMYDRYETGEMEAARNMLIQDSTEYYTDNGRIVYGGGGIMPDVFVPIDTLSLDEDYLTLRQYVPQYVFRYLGEAADPAALAEQGLDRFIATFTVDDAMLQGLITYAEEHGDPLAAAELSEPVRHAARHMLKARIAKQLFEDEGYYKVWNMEDAMVKEALKAIARSTSLTASQQ
ncbi:S41 family peptidase [Phaeodactylibacter sp.]|jgi:carboxyl-terminal processing protease|uniref:S41 family peptidase n=1 Tax=Phaeodactylibacter sp. TaxID=1940289 RepID=UPI0025E9820C|nr:S41 family peptidase [Phaeodactylibacter sp.]MCI4648534.1 S41 family peptidase [Phaeodactylibacter sp.]MCI5090118.1 S41 family peptidase [Phaeodactylibacter sp.]